MKKIFKITTYLLLVFTIITLVFSGIAYFLARGINLDLNRLKRNDTAVTVCYADGSLMEQPNSGDYVKFENLPKHIINAVVAIEDKRFYSHNGVDFKSILRAIKNNVFTTNAKQGGSTITQQLIKNTYLSGEKTLNRKLKEMRLAIELEKKLSKNQILEAYLNTVYFGEGAYGISSASKKFFNKTTSELSIEEGATLVACLKAPSYYSPYKNIERSKKRRDLVLKEMLNQGYISSNEYSKAKNTDIILNFNNNYENKNSLYDDVLQEAMTSLRIDNTSDLNGYKIYTSIEKSILEIIPSVKDYKLDCDVSVIITENHSGKIVGYYSTVGNVKRCPASTSKPWLIYAPAIEENLICLATKILDEKTNFDGYKPSNYNDKYYGYVSVKDCLSKSLNIPSIKICNMLGLDKVKNYAKSLNIDYSNNDLSIALGNLSGGITLQELSDAYSVFSNEGKYLKGGFIDKITNNKGKIIYQRDTSKRKIFSDSTVYLINDALLNCVQNGTANKLKDLDFEVCAKTGTNGNEKGNVDAYCIAYTTKHRIAVWLGNANGDLIGNNITGGNYPSQIAKDVFKEIYTTYKPDKFIPPKSVKEVSINKLYYLNDCKIYLNNGDEKDGVKFWFKSDYKIENMPKEKVLPIIKSYKISCKYCKIEIFCETDQDVYYKIQLQNGEELFDSYKSDKFEYRAPKDGEYTFIATPYFFDGEEIIYGEKIKLPSVLTEGKSNILDTDWWED